MAVRVNGHFTEVKQLVLRLILRLWPYILSFFSLAMIGRNMRQICQILLISWSFRKTQMSASQIKNIYVIHISQHSQFVMGTNIHHKIMINCTDFEIVLFLKLKLSWKIWQICLIFLPNLSNLPNSVKIKSPLNISKLFLNFISFWNVLIVN